MAAGAEVVDITEASAVPGRSRSKPPVDALSAVALALDKVLRRTGEQRQMHVDAAAVAPSTFAPARCAENLDRRQQDSFAAAVPNVPVCVLSEPLPAQ